MKNIELPMSKNCIKCGAILCYEDETCLYCGEAQNKTGSITMAISKKHYKDYFTPHEGHNIVKDETYTWPIFSGFTVFNFSADWASDMFVDIITSDATDPTVMRNVRITCIKKMEV